MKQVAEHDSIPTMYDLPDITLERILQHLSLADQWALGCTCTHIRTLVEGYLGFRSPHLSERQQQQGQQQEQPWEQQRRGQQGCHLQHYAGHRPCQNLHEPHQQGQQQRAQQRYHPQPQPQKPQQSQQQQRYLSHRLQHASLLALADGSWRTTLHAAAPRPVGESGTATATSPNVARTDAPTTATVSLDAVDAAARSNSNQRQHRQHQRQRLPPPRPFTLHPAPAGRAGAAGVEYSGMHWLPKAAQDGTRTLALDGRLLVLAGADARVLAGHHPPREDVFHDVRRRGRGRGSVGPQEAAGRGRREHLQELGGAGAAQGVMAIEMGVDPGLGPVWAPRESLVAKLPRASCVWLAPLTPAAAHLSPATWPQPAVYRPPRLPPCLHAPPPPPPPPATLPTSTSSPSLSPSAGGLLSEWQTSSSSSSSSSGGGGGVGGGDDDGSDCPGGLRYCSWCGDPRDCRPCSGGLCARGCGGAVAVLPAHPWSPACSEWAADQIESLVTGHQPYRRLHRPLPGSEPHPPHPPDVNANADHDDDVNPSHLPPLTFLDCSYHGAYGGPLGRRLAALAASCPGPAGGGGNDDNDGALDLGPGSTSTGAAVSAAAAASASSGHAASAGPSLAGPSSGGSSSSRGGSFPTSSTPSSSSRSSLLGALLASGRLWQLRHLLAVRAVVGPRELGFLGRQGYSARLVTIDLSGATTPGITAAAAAAGPAAPPVRSAAPVPSASAPGDPALEFGRALRQAVERLTSLQVLRLQDMDLQGFFSPCSSSSSVSASAPATVVPTPAAASPPPTFKKPTTTAGASNSCTNSTTTPSTTTAATAAFTGSKPRARAGAVGDLTRLPVGGDNRDASTGPVSSGSEDSAPGDAMRHEQEEQAEEERPVVHEPLACLRHLDLEGSSGFGAAELAAVLRVATRLTHLGVGRCRGLVLQHQRRQLQTQPPRRSLDSSRMSGISGGGGGVGAGGGGDRAEAPCLTHLRSLSVGWGFDTVSVRQLCVTGGSTGSAAGGRGGAVAPYLTALKLGVGAAVNDAGLAAVAAACPHLQDLRLELCGVSAEGVGAVLAACGKLHVLHVINCVGPFGREALLGRLGWLPQRWRQQQGGQQGPEAEAEAYGVRQRWAMSDLHLVGGPMELYDEDVLSLMYGRPVYGCYTGAGGAGVEGEKDGDHGSPSGVYGTSGDCSCAGGAAGSGTEVTNNSSSSSSSSSSHDSGGTSSMAGGEAVGGRCDLYGNNRNDNRLRHLHTLALVGLPLLSNALLLHLRNHATSVRHVRLERCGYRPLPCADTALAGCGGLCTGPFTSAGMLGWLQRCEGLCNLRLRHCCQWDSDVVYRLAFHCPALEVLMLDGCDLHPTGFEAEPSQHGALSYVMVARCRPDPAGTPREEGGPPGGGGGGGGLLPDTGSGSGSDQGGPRRPARWQWQPLERDVKVIRFGDGVATKLPLYTL